MPLFILSLVLSVPIAFGAEVPRSNPADPPEIVVYAASSLRDALEALAPECQRALGVRLVFNFGASSDLARQIEAANKADVFFSADAAWMDHVEKAGLVDTDSRRSPISNRLVVVSPAESALHLATASDLADPKVRRLSLANPESVPAGKYAKAWLASAGVWESVKDRVVPALDVRAALAAVASGACDAGIVYRTDASISKSVKVLLEVREDEGPRISYALAALSRPPSLDASRRVVAWLAGAEASKTFDRFGFVVSHVAP